MDIQTQQALHKVQYWFGRASNWQKDLLCTIWEGTTKDEQILNRAIKLSGQEFLNEACHFAPKTAFPEGMTFSETKKAPVILKSIENVEGVGALAPTAPLQFENGLTVVYGENGCGKSSYVRILKSLENHLNAGDVLGNVFDGNPTPAKADVVFSLDGKEHTITWTKAYKTKCPLQIYDSVIAKQFVDKENEVLYEPKALSMITQMAIVFENVSSFYKKKLQDNQQQMIVPQQDFRLHPIVKEFEELNTLHSLKSFEKKYLWDSTKETELTDIVESL